MFLLLRTAVMRGVVKTVFHARLRATVFVFRTRPSVDTTQPLADTSDGLAGMLMRGSMNPSGQRSPISTLLRFIAEAVHARLPSRIEMQICCAAVFFVTKRDAGRLLELLSWPGWCMLLHLFPFPDRWMAAILVSKRSRSTTFLISHSLAAGKLVSVQNLRPE